MFVKDIHDALYPILLATATLGLSSVFIKSENNIRKLKIFNWLKIMNIIYLSVFTYLVYSTISDYTVQHLRANYAWGVSKIGIIFQLIAQISLTYVLYTINITKSPNILKIIRDIKKIDEIFEDLGEHLNYRRHFIIEMCLISTGFIVLWGRSIITYLYMSKNIFSYANPHAVVSFPSFVSYLIQIHFVLLILLLQERFRLINKLLLNLTHTKGAFSKVQISYEYHVKHRIKRVELLMKLHDYLTDVGNKINECFTIQILTCLTAQFLTEVFTIFYLYYESLILKNRIAAFVWSIWTVWTTLEIFCVTITCQLTCKEARITGMTIHKVLMFENEPCIKRKLMIFSHQVSHRPLQFTACGLFSIDTTLIFTIAGAATTYLLIMLQFQEGIEAQCSNVTRIK